MPSSHLPKALGVLDLDQDQRDWIGQFPVELDPARPQHSLRRNSQTLFTVVRYERPLPIMLPPPSADAETLSPSGHRHRSLLKRARRAVSPTLTALFIAYIAVVFMTAWIGVRRGESTRKGDASSQVSTWTEGFEPSNRP